MTPDEEMANAARLAARSRSEMPPDIAARCDQMLAGIADEMRRFGLDPNDPRILRAAFYGAICATKFPPIASAAFGMMQPEAHL
jgi:hypothetical protein